MHESSGLRFDIYERVHLPQEAADIREIEEIELTPCVQAERRGDQVVLRGSLLLGGVYLSDDETRGSRQLEHWIPVEITLPQERVGRLEDVAVEVDNFDVDLLDQRTLNITGVLTLRGVAAGPSASRQQTYAWGEEPYTVVHRRARELPEETAAETAGGYGRTADESGEPAGEYAQADGVSEWTAGEYAQVGESARADDGKEQAAAEPGRSFASAVDAAEREPAEWRSADDREAEDAADFGEAGAEDTALGEAAASAPGVRAGAAPSGDEFAGQPEPLRETVQTSGPLEWKAFAAQSREHSKDEADRARRGTDETGSGEAGYDPDAEAAPPAADAEEAGVRDDAARTESPEAADGRNGAQEDLPTETLAAGAPISDAGGSLQPASGKADLKVAVGAKRTDETPGADGAPGIGKLFFPDRREARAEAGLKAQAQEVPEPAQPREAAEPARRQASSDEVDWKSLFRGAAAQESFRTVRLCIVQKDDTLDAIAGRYQRNPREIALANRLEGSTVTEGQVLFIP